MCQICVKSALHNTNELHIPDEPESSVLCTEQGSEGVDVGKLLRALLFPGCSRFISEKERGVGVFLLLG